MEKLTPGALKAYIESIREKYQLPALAVGVSQQGKLDIIIARGIRRAGNDTPVLENDPFYIGSCGKAVTAALIHKLVQNGQLDLHDTLGDLFSHL